MNRGEIFLAKSLFHKLVSRGFERLETKLGDQVNGQEGLDVFRTGIDNDQPGKSAAVETRSPGLTLQLEDTAHHGVHLADVEIGIIIARRFFPLPKDQPDGKNEVDPGPELQVPLERDRRFDARYSPQPRVGKLDAVEREKDSIAQSGSDGETDRLRRRRIGQIGPGQQRQCPPIHGDILRRGEKDEHDKDKCQKVDVYLFL